MAKSTLKNIPVSSGEIIDLEIESMGYDNSAIARHKDFVVMVNRAAPKDKLKAEITTIKPNYSRAKIKELIESDSEYRIEPNCKIFKICGGCQWQHLPYEKQLEQKDFLMKNFASKLSLKEGVLKPIISAKKNLDSDEGIWHYRNKVQYPVRTVPSTGRLKAGYYEWNSNDLINIKYCPIQHEKFDSIVDSVREIATKYKITAYDSKTKKGILRHISIRSGFNTNQYLLTLVVAKDKFPKIKDFINEIDEKNPELEGVCLNINTGTTNVIHGPVTKVLKGKGFMYEEINGIKFKISATSFFQVNTAQATMLINEIKEKLSLKGDEVVLDAYCGSGFIGLSISNDVKKVIGIEEIESAVIDGNDTAKENGIKNIEYTFGKVENKISDVMESSKPDVVILDPPRAGCNKRVLKTICETPPEKIIYVSCNPTTLMRDLEILSEELYSVSSIQPIDMFPHTFHIENVVLLEKKN